MNTIHNDEYDPFLVGLIRHKLGKKKGKKRKFKHILRDQFMPLPMLMHKRRKARKRAKRQAQRVQQMAKKPIRVQPRPTVISGTKPIRKPLHMMPKKEVKHATSKALPDLNSDTKEKESKNTLWTPQNMLIGTGIGVALVSVTVILTRAIVKK